MERIPHSEWPEGMYPLMANVEAYIAKSGLDQKLVKLLKFRVSQINSCAYCLDMHYKEAIHIGETPQRLYSVSAWRETPYYTPKEQAALAFAETLTHLPAEEHSDHIHDELDKYFSKKEIAHLTLVIAQINTWNRLVRSFGTVPGGYQVREKAAAN
ncbi:carboxymuconolactone decarboxylase family protein [Pseudoflavitalea sp. X16]|uniref:carboxymuconolactone decarboxylase family protein n=1 Tax=Paraflavitalea devenefica TaxID=2716334 RepID=UPI00141EA05F|nr:carboxymuconolactone decarboxylase family protein [Paraflavitalea devenefica]NII27168.1 carboxymuconolactone decarboxylase family protein [Paraflavitalea devenefica]